MGKVIHEELCKRLKYDHADKWYMLKPESVLENEAPKILWYFKIKTDLPILTKRRTCQGMDLAVLADRRMKIKETENINTYLDLAKELFQMWII